MTGLIGLALFSSVLWSMATPAAQAAGVARSGVCTGDDPAAVTLVIDASRAGGGLSTVCVSNFSGNGLNLLDAAGVSHEGTAKDGASFVCRLNGLPSADQESCVTTPPMSAYWSYWSATPGGSWGYAARGVTGAVTVGSYVGWSFGSMQAPGVGTPAWAPATPPPAPDPIPAPDPVPVDPVPVPDPAPAGQGSSTDGQAGGPGVGADATGSGNKSSTAGQSQATGSGTGASAGAVATDATVNSDGQVPTEAPADPATSTASSSASPTAGAKASHATQSTPETTPGGSESESGASGTALGTLIALGVLVVAAAGGGAYAWRLRRRGR